MRTRQNAGVDRGAKTPTSPCERDSRSTVGCADHHAACDNPDTTVDLVRDSLAETGWRPRWLLHVGCRRRLMRSGELELLA